MGEETTKHGNKRGQKFWSMRSESSGSGMKKHEKVET